ncbi:MlaD family protein [Flavobacterium sp. GT3R68]|uniref:MlaD family protein n=1 Tax=Flavobacterium sp. GT3R68 TaxID=2594437 RepID=UPI000F896782|nr:MlaD family protein [Flavobacterium sp. GT3R68]RTY93613.1 MCE family protein [Flavobacterium sp. GSN2]TRW91666.1 MCE family protein [Flavobacterium sp. GT3R68]
MKITREIKTAILVIASILLFIWGYSFLKGKDLFTDYRTFYVQYDNVEGLAASAPVTINGLVVGKVTTISIDNTTGKLIVELQIKSDFPVSKSSLVAIYEPGLIGGKQIQIIPNYTDKVLAKSGDTLQGSVKKGLTDLVGEKLTPLQDKVEKTVVSADSLLTSLNKVLDAKTKENLKSSIAHLNQTMAQFSDASKSVNTILDGNKEKIAVTMTNLNKVSSDFSKISDSLSKANISRTVKNLGETLAKVDKIMDGVQSGKGTLGKMMTDEALYNNLDKTSKELELLLQDLRLNPTRYVNVSLFGKKNKPYIAPVNDTISKAKN